jgi:hypothetical protein
MRISQLLFLALFCICINALAETKSVSKPVQIHVPIEFQGCKTDSECQDIISVCSCCTYEAINKNFIDKYEQFEQDCSAPPPPCSCKEMHLVPKCVNNVCTLSGPRGAKVAAIPEFKCQKQAEQLGRSLSRKKNNIKTEQLENPVHSTEIKRGNYVVYFGGRTNYNKFEFKLDKNCDLVKIIDSEYAK